MRAWQLRLFGFVVVLVAAYLAYASSHQAPVILACSGGAAVLAILSVALLWGRPAIGTPLAVIFLIAGIVAPTVVVPRVRSSMQAGTAPASPSAAEPQAAGSQATASAVSDIVTTPSPLPPLKAGSGALSAPQTDIDFSEFLGPATVASEDGFFKQFGEGTTKSGNDVLRAFGNGPPATPSSTTAAHLRDLASQIPEKEYSLIALAASAPSDPVQLYRFVRDNIDIDLYDGVMRGPLGTWLGRAGSPSDKTLLLAWLFANKHIHYQFARGMLSSDERNQIANESASVKLGQPDAQTAKHGDDYANPLISKAQPFVTWAKDNLARARVATATMPQPSDRIGPTHYWIQIDSGGKLLDLDPTLAGMQEGRHLGSIDGSFKPYVTLPADEYHMVQLRLNAIHADGSTQRVLTYTSRVEDVAYAPLRLAIFPHGMKSVKDIPGATTFDAVVLIGKVAEVSKVALGSGPSALSQLIVEIARKGPGLPQQTSHRWLLDASAPAAERALRISGLTTMVVAPGVANNAYTIRQRMLEEAQQFDDYALTKAGQKPALHLLYPIRILEYFSHDDSVAARLPVRLFRNRPNIAAQRTFPTNAGPDYITQFDIIDNAMSSAVPDGGAVFTANLARGYADTQIERENNRPGDGYGTIALFDAAKGAGVPAQILASAESASNDPLKLGVADTLVGGRLAIAPALPVKLGGTAAYGWWDVDPSTGSTVGRMTGGLGVAMEEDVLFGMMATGNVVAFYAIIATTPECRSGPRQCAAAICRNYATNESDGALHVHGVIAALGGTLGRFTIDWRSYPCGG